MPRPTRPLPQGLLKDLMETPPDRYPSQGHLILAATARTENPETLANQKRYWTEKGFHDWQESSDGETLTARRGSTLGNVFSFKVSKLIAEVTLTHRDQTLEIKLDTSTRHQVISLWNYLDLKLQLHEAAHLAHTGKPTPELWQEYNRLAKKALYTDWRRASLFWHPPDARRPQP